MIGLSSLGAGDFILRGLITFKICGMPSYGWAMVTKIVHQLKLLQLLRFDDRIPSMARVITIYRSPSVTEDIKICQSYCVVIEPPVAMFHSVQWSPLQKL